MPMKRCPSGHYYDSGKYTACPYCGVQSINLDNMETQAKPNNSSFPNLSANMKKCPNGHFYDSSKFSSCPSCWGSGKEAEVTQAKRKEAQMPQENDRDEGRTIGILHKNIGIDPVVGWLVCVEGNDKGRDYRIRSEKNFIGRSEKMDICISGDESILRENHAAVSYSPKKNSFKLHAGDGRGLVYLNGEEVDGSEELKPYDVIELGNTKLMFIPFCGEGFVWEQKIKE